MSNEAAEEAVGKISTHLSIAEGHLLKAIAALGHVPKLLVDIHDAGPLELPEGVVQFGYIEMIGYAGRAAQLGALVGGALTEASVFHDDAYARAKEMQIDSAVGTLGGGGR